MRGRFPPSRHPAGRVYLALKPGAERRRPRPRGRTGSICWRCSTGTGWRIRQPGATHWFGQLGKHQLKWESHTEFVTYTMFSEGVADRRSTGQFSVFPEDWLAAAPAPRNHQRDDPDRAGDGRRGHP